MAGSRPQSNFTHLKAHDEQLVRLGLLAERYFAEDPNTCLLKLRQLTGRPQSEQRQTEGDLMPNVRLPPAMPRRCARPAGLSAARFIEVIESQTVWEEIQNNK